MSFKVSSQSSFLQTPQNVYASDVKIFFNIRKLYHNFSIILQTVSEFFQYPITIFLREI